jgi:hypothetical protein
MNRRGSVALVVALVIVVVLVAAGGVWYYETYKPSAAVIATNNNIAAATSTILVFQSSTNAFTSSEYGVSVQIPSGATFDSQSDNTNLSYNFIDQSGAVFLGTIQAPSVRGTFTASVSTAIKNRVTCDQFAEIGETSSTMTVNGITYTNMGRGSAAAGTEFDAETFHAYQNNFCYEFIFTASYSGVLPSDNPSNADVTNMQNALLKGISFSTPLALPPKENSAPSIISFTAAPQVQGGTNIPIADDLIFSWTTQGVDYVQLSYPCPQYLNSSYNAGNPNCVGFGNNAISSSTIEYSPNGSTTIFFDYKNFDESKNGPSPTLSPIPLTLTLEPFINGIGYPNLDKTVTITVTPS